MADVVVTQASAVMELLWPLLGGNHTDAETWQAISDALQADRIAARKQALEEAAKVARDCALYDGKDRLLNSDIRATCAAAIRAIGDKEDG